MYSFGRVAIADQNRSHQKLSSEQGTKVHVSFSSFFPANSLLKPTEVFIHKSLIGYGKMIDVTVKDYTVYRDQNLQEGYGFVTMASHEAALKLVENVQDTCFDGIVLTCQLTHQHNQSLMKMKDTPSNPMPLSVQTPILPFVSMPPPPLYPIGCNTSMHMPSTPIDNGQMGFAGFSNIAPQPIYYLPLNNASFPCLPPSDNEHSPTYS